MAQTPLYFQDIVGNLRHCWRRMCRGFFLWLGNAFSYPGPRCNAMTTTKAHNRLPEKDVSDWVLCGALLFGSGEF